MKHEIQDNFFSLDFSKCYCVGFRRGLVWNWRLICLWLFLQRHHVDAWTLLALNSSLGFMKYKYPHPKLKPPSWLWLSWNSQGSADSRSVPCPRVWSPLATLQSWSGSSPEGVLDAGGTFVLGICSKDSSSFCTAFQWHHVVMILWFRKELFKLLYTHFSIYFLLK